MNRTIGELLFDGYEDTVMEIGSSMDSDDDYFDDEEGEEEIEEDANKVPMDKFGWFYKVIRQYATVCMKVYSHLHLEAVFLMFLQSISLFTLKPV